MRPVSPLPFLLPPFPSQRRAEFLIYINTRTLMVVNCGKFTSPRERERISLNASTLPQLLFGRILMSYRYIFEMFYNHVCLKDNASLDDRNIIELNSFSFFLSLPLLLFLINLQLARLTRSNVSRVSNCRRSGSIDFFEFRSRSRGNKSNQSATKERNRIPGIRDYCRF